MRRRLACPSLHGCICFLLLLWPLIKMSHYPQINLPNREQQIENPRHDSNLKDHQRLQIGYLFAPWKIDDRHDKFLAKHEPCKIIRNSVFMISACLNELDHEKGTRTQCRPITERERERRRNEREVSGHVDEGGLQLKRNPIEILARFFNCCHVHPTNPTERIDQKKL